MDRSEVAKAWRGDGWIGGAQDFFEQWKYSVWGYHDGYMSLYIVLTDRMYNTESKLWTLGDYEVSV